MAECPFCNPEPARIFLQGRLVFGLWDAYPVADGHALLITRRHIPSWFEANEEEQLALIRAVAAAKSTIELDHRPQGYNIGVNIGEAAGQTVPHLHLHVIPRYIGDVPDPRGGVRYVLEERANYLVKRAERPTILPGLPHARHLVRGGVEDPLLPHLIAQLDTAQRVDIAVAFTLESGIRLVEEYFRDILERGGSIRYLTGDYLGVTEPQALRLLLDLPGDFELRVFQSSGRSFHPKAYVVHNADGSSAAFVGSSNMSATALREGVEWNYRALRKGDEAGFSQVSDAFEALFHDARCASVDEEWLAEYERAWHPAKPSTTGEAPSPEYPIPEPHEIQREALAALAATRREGNSAGLVVLATGLGKTWLSAFDSSAGKFDRVLFVAHREEILEQAMRTFRAIRPKARLGLYTGTEKMADAEVLFASIQTLGRMAHLRQFDSKHFDYVIVDEFHHAAAQTYRRLLGYFEPDFLLGLTATPERTDGADLLALCGDNLVYQCDLTDGIRRELLCPFDYFGVPDVVDYDNIPWRSSRFDEEALTAQVATKARADNALEQLRLHGGKRTIGFCVSQRHADFMAEYSCTGGLRAAAVHAGAKSAPRAHSLQALADGDIDIVYAVDMFNEGLDMPNIDTVMMLRPTESRILWLQQFGRGLRALAGKRLKVIDYIGNHRVFLTKTRALLGLGDTDADIAHALTALDNDAFELPPECSVTYELEAKNILRALLRPNPPGLEQFYRDFVERNGRRPTALEVSEGGYDPRAARKRHGSWFAFVQDMGGFSEHEARAFETIKHFMAALETTPMVKSYKMVVLLAMLGENAFPGTISLSTLVTRFRDLARRHAPVRTEIGNAIDDDAQLRNLIVQNPIAAWAGGRGTDGVSYFAIEGETFGTTADINISDELSSACQDLAWELAEWRFHDYLKKTRIDLAAGRIICKVSHSNGRPIIFLPDRATNEGVPEGWQDVSVDGEAMQAKFVKIAVNVITRANSEENLLPEILKRWFGKDAGAPGTTQRVQFTREGERYNLAPLTNEPGAYGPQLWAKYKRDEIPNLFNIEFSGFDRQAGVVRRAGHLLLFVTLDKGDLEKSYQYSDEFLSPSEFKWQSQNRTRLHHQIALDISQHKEKGIQVHLFVRPRKKEAGKTAPFTYCGRLQFVRWEGEAPITVWWTLDDPLSSEVATTLLPSKSGLR